ncbi:MAG: D-2-hydroxyacid dehydrogenase [Nitrososphaeraceae archaeon]
MQLTGNVLVCDPISKIGITILKKAGLNVVDKPSITNSELESEVENFEVIVVRSRTKITNGIISKAKNAKIIARVGVGLDNIDVESARQNNIEVVNSPESAINAVAELVVGLMLSLSRNLTLADRGMKKGNWMKKDLNGIELRGKYLGIVGVGNIGRNLARIARSLRMNIIGYDTFPIKQDFIKEVGMITTDFNTLVASSDFISCHVPLALDTKHMFNEATFSNMKSTAFFINSSRGEIVDENALYSALITKKIAGAALDVFEVEPPTNLKLIQLPNIICTPHIGAQTLESQDLASNVIAEKIIHKLLEK